MLGFIVLVACPAAAAHGGGGAALGYNSTITEVRPAIPGVTLEILDGDDRLLLTNEGSEEVVVLGYEGEPYLRVTRDGVFRNANSPATYLNEDRYGQAALPDTASADAPPDWVKIDDDPRVEWHDHRIHWMSTSPPPVVQADPDSSHRILDWQVPLEVNGEPVTVAGKLDYEPPSESMFSPILFVPLAVILLVGAAALWVQRRNERRNDAAPGNPLGTRAARGRDGVR